MRIPLSSSTPVMLVGRDRELGVLRECLAAALAQHGSLVLIGGEAGMGKTALAETLCREAMEQGALVLVGRCYDLSDTAPYAPWIDAFDRYRTDGRLPPVPAAFARRGSIGPVTSAVALFAGVRDFLTAVATKRPVVILLEDAHWQDAASLDLLRFVARHLGEHPLLVLVTFRSEEVARQHPLYNLLPMLVREANAERLDLRPLDDAAVRALVDGRYGLDAADADRLISYLRERAEGNALFIGELLRSLGETGTLRQSGGRWTLGTLDEAPVPTLLLQVIGTRLNRLNEETQRLLAVAAVVGQEVPYLVWATVAGVNEERLITAVADAKAAHLMAETSDGMGAIFSHALVRETVYEAIRPSQRRGWHRRVGEVLTALPDADPDSVANHFQRAGDERAIEWLIRAGQRAHRAWAWPTAQQRYNAALKAVGETDATIRGALLFRLATLSVYADTPQAIRYLDEAYRLALIAQDERLAANAVFSQGRFRCLTGEVQRGLAEMAAGVAALAALGPAAVSSATSDVTEMPDVHWARGSLLSFLATSGRYAEVNALDVAMRAGAPSDTAAADRRPFEGVQRGLRAMHAALGQPAAAAAAYQLARTALVESGDALHVGLLALEHLHDAVLPYHADDLAMRERVAAEAEEAYREAIREDERLPPRRGRLPLLVLEGRWGEARAVAEAVLAAGGHGAYISHARSLLAPLAYAQGDTARAWRLVEEALPEGAAIEPGTMLWYRETLTLQAVAVLLCLDAGDLPAARAWLLAHDDWLAWSGTVTGRAEGRLLWARYYRASGDLAVAHQHAIASLAQAEAPRQPLALLAAYRIIGELDTEMGRDDDAAGALGAALALADTCRAPYERAATMLALAELRATTGEGAMARALLDEVKATCTPLGAQPILARVDALTVRLIPASPEQAIYPAGLSAREVEVLRLVAAGRTNGEIAELLFLSRRTVQVHVAHILAKTHADNRAAAAAFAQRHGLA